MNDFLNTLQNLINEGKTLIKTRPRSQEHEDLGSEKEIESRAKCQKWFMKCSNLLKEVFTINSNEYKIFVSFYKTWKVGLLEQEVSFVKDDMLNQIYHLEAIEEILQNKNRRLTSPSLSPDQKDLKPIKKVKKTFVSMSFEDSDKGINDYVIKILKSLKIDYDTGESYSNYNIPTKVEMRIRNSDVFILILIGRNRLEIGGYTAPAWLMKELGIAQGHRKEIIAWVENNIKDIGGLDQEKELIYFARDDLIEMEKATIKFLEALKEHGLT